jgi:uncharacterized membrane protein
MVSELIKEIGKIVSFLGVQYALGRRGSFPYGIFMKFSLEKITLLVIFSDMAQTLMLLHCFDYFVKRWQWLKKFQDKLNNSAKENSLRHKIKKARHLGLVIISALPYGGGALTGSIMAASLKIDRRQAFLTIMSGCIIGTFLYYLVFKGIVAVFF